MWEIVDRVFRQGGFVTLTEQMSMTSAERACIDDVIRHRNDLARVEAKRGS